MLLHFPLAHGKLIDVKAHADLHHVATVGEEWFRITTFIDLLERVVGSVAYLQLAWWAVSPTFSSIT